MRPVTRRTLLQSLAGWLGSSRSAEAVDGDWLRRPLHGFACSSISSFRYRIDAAILFGGAPLFTRRGVGEAYASVECGEPANGAAVVLEFAAGCWPERCRGLNRFGILQEAAIGSEDGNTGFVFAGLITASRADTLAEADNGADVTLARGVIRDGRATAWTEHVHVPPGLTWTDAAGLLGRSLRRDPACAPREIHNGQLYGPKTQRESAGDLVCAIWNGAGVKAAQFRTSYRAGGHSGLSHIPPVFTKEAF